MKRIKGDRVVYGFKHEMEPIDRVKPGEEFIVETNDCFFQQINSQEQVLLEIDFERLNPATGPIYIEGAEIGDILCVEVLDIEVKSRGVAAVIPNGGLLGDQVKNPIIRLIDIVDGRANYCGLSLPIEPMIGVIGLATSKEDENIPTSTPYKHGGNMDTKDIRKGTKIYFPVRQEGGLLALGDLHALMGDGELCFTGLEIPGEVKLRLELIKDRKLEWPMIETEEATEVIASGEDLEKALYEAVSQMVGLIQAHLNISFEEAYIMASLVVDARISQVVNPKKTARASLSKDIIATEDLIGALD